MTIQLGKAGRSHKNLYKEEQEMKTWSQPEVEELNVRATAYSPVGGMVEDGVYQSDDGKYTIPTYGPSSGNSGEPTVDVQ